MNLLQRLLNLALSKRSVPTQSGGWWGKTQAGIYVDHSNALQISAVFACVRVIAETIGALPWHVYARSAGQNGRSRRELLGNRDEAWLLGTQPNPEMSAQTFRETILGHALLWGSGYAEIERDANGRPVWLWPLTPDRVTPARTDPGGLVYRIAQPGGNEIAIDASEMFHVRGLGWDGINGYSVVRHAAQSLGLTVAMERFGSSFFGNGAHPGNVLEHPGKLGDQAHANLKKSVDDATAGRNAGKTLLLEEGMKWHPMTIPPEEAQFLESRKFQIDEICRWFRVPPHMVADLEHATFSNIEHQSIEFVTHTLMPWVTRLEQEANLKLFGRVNRGTIYTKIELNGLLRGDMKSRFEAYHLARLDGWLSGNDIRELEERNAVDGLDDYLVPANVVPADMLRDITDARAHPPTPQPIDPTAPAPQPTPKPAKALRSVTHG